MTEAEKLAQRLSDLTPFIDGDEIIRDEAAALIREQEAKINRMAQALRDLHKNSWHGSAILRASHAAALAIAKERA